MCLITRQEKAKIAKKDIEVYKEVIEVYKEVEIYSSIINSNSNIINSKVQGFQYIIGKKYSTELAPKSISGLRIGIDFKVQDEIVSRIYSQICYAYGHIIITNDNIKVISKGFHSFKTKNRSHYNAICIIPKGSEYFEDETGLIVSNQIIIKRIIKN